MNLLGFIMSLVYMQAVHGRLSTYERLVNSQNFFSPYLTQEDLSRFGRDYLTVGQYTDIIFPSYDVRFIAVNDGVDSNRGDSEGFAAIRNLFNEWYPRDTSKKVRVSLRQRGTSGKHMGKPPYGYRCDPEDKDH